jgi:exonuclease SbcD
MSEGRIRFFHTADIHFGVENYGRIDPQTGIHTRLLDFEIVLSLCIDRAIAEQIDAFVFAGDAYKTAYPTPTQQKLLLQQLFRLQEAGIAVVIVVGNHDHPLSFGRAHALDLFGQIRHKGFYLFSKPQAVCIQTRSGPINVVGIPWPMRHNVLAHDQHQLKTASEITQYLSERVCQIIAKLAAGLDPKIPAVLVGHLTVASGVFSGSERRAVYGTDPLFMPSQLAITPFDYVALGHLHRHQNLNPSGQCPVVYAGSPERVDFGERKEPKGYCDVTITFDAERKKTEYTFVELPARPMIQIDVTLESVGNATEQVLAAVARYDLTDAIVKVVYQVPAGQRDMVDTAQVQRACRAAHYIAGIVPVHVVLARSQRAVVSTQMSSDELLKTYFSSKEIDTTRQQQLLALAHELIELQARVEEQQEGDEAHE